MLEFSQFDRRRYPTVSVREGYREWLPSYETTVEDEMDLVLLQALESIPWTTVARAADLGCGTGRTGAWLRTRGVAKIDGIDLTPEMLALARRRGIYDGSIKLTSPRPGSKAASTISSRRAWWTSTSPICSRCTVRSHA
jgi:SAM-dependent methyltransferase